jgi:hypothetical protein
MEEGDEKSKGMTPERVVKILARHQEIITVQQAKRMLEMVNLLAGIAVNQYLRNTKS